MLSKALIVFLLCCAFQNAWTQKTNSSKEEIKSYFQESLLLKNQNKSEEALNILKKASDVSEKNEDVKGLIDTYHKFAIIYLDINKDNNAEFYWDRAEILLNDISYPYGIATHKYIEALRLYKRENNFQAIYMLDDAKRHTNDRNLLNNILLAEAKLYLSIEKYDKAQKNYNSLLVNTDVYEKKYIITKAYIGLSNLALKLDNVEASILNAEKALAIASENKFNKEVLELNSFLSTLYEALGKYDLSLNKTKNLLAVKDSIFTIEKIKIESRTGDKINRDMMAETIAKQDLRIDELTEAQSRSEITAILTSAFLTIISLLAVSLYRNNQIKLKTNDLLQTKNKELGSARDAAVSAMEAKTNFLSTVSHELRTPLYAVTGLTHLLLEENPSKNQLEHLKSLKFSGDYLLNFINDILQINKIDAQKLEPLTISVNLNKVLAETINSLQQSAKENKTKITLDYDDDLPENLLGDPIKLSQIFMNLIGNAIKFTKEGQVTVLSKLIKKNDKEVTVYFEVKDSGIGISDDFQKDIFESFEQGSVQINREYGGTGLGLTIVKSLLGLFGSKIELKSKIGEGSTFFFSIDMKYREGSSEVNHIQTKSSDYNFEGLHLMVVEDNKINQVITKKMLVKKGMTCDIANNGMEAVENAKNNKYNAILMDIHMPGISGEEATIQIREFDKEIPIIALTAISLDDSLESFYAAGCDDVVTKPFKPEVFYQKIGENIFDKKRQIKDSVS